MTLERRLMIYPAHDRTAEGGGRNAVEMHFAVVGPKGAYVFQLHTGWGVDGTQWHRLMAAGADYHAHEAQYEGQFQQEQCVYTGGPCYSDGSILYSDQHLKALLTGGSEAVWALLEADYARQFEEVVVE